MDIVRKKLEELTLGEMGVFKILTMLALVSSDRCAVDYLTLGDALDLEVARVCRWRRA